MLKKQASRSWKARLELQFSHLDSKTRLVRNRHLGPLRVLKPYYPEVDGTAHTYILHPPGGLVVGDELDIDIDLHANSHSLLTVPSASKIYDTGVLGHQRQHVHVRCGRDAVCEWLPQETIVFEGANAQLRNTVELAEGAEFAGWEIICLGRPECNERFDRGSITSLFKIYREGRLLTNDRLHLAGGDKIMNSAIGFQAQPNYGQFYATGNFDAEIGAWRECLSVLVLPDEKLVLSQIRPGLFCARYLGLCSERAKNIFTQLWGLMRPVQLSKSAVKPRIWNT